MNEESESEQTRRTVAELLAQYGEGSGEVAPRRRRRRAEDASDTAPQAIIDRVNSDSGRFLPVRDEPPPPPPPPPPAAQRQRPVDQDRTAYQQPVAPRPDPVPPRAEPIPPSRPDLPKPPRAEPPRLDPSRLDAPRLDQPRLDQSRLDQSRLDAPRLDQSRLDQPRLDPPVDPRRRAVPPPSAAEETRQVPPIVDDYADYADYEQAAQPPRPPAPDLSRPNLVRPGPPMVKPPVKTPVPPPVREPVTEVMPRITDKLKPNVPLESLPTESVLIVPPAPARLPDPLPGQSPEDWFGDDEDEPADEQESTQFHPYVDLDEEDDEEDYRRRELDDEPAGLADVDEDEPERSPGREWLVMIGQLAVGVIGGAALWLGFNFLWRTLAPAALVVALVVTVGLVMLVRKIRRADDLQTTILAVLVGLIVTVSPAAMLLVRS